MIKKRVSLLGGIVLLATAAGVEAQKPRSSFAPANEAARSIDIASEPASYEQASSSGVELDVRAVCSKSRSRRADVSLSWEDGVAGEVRVDITGYNDGFSTGRYLTSGPRSSRARGLYFLDGEAGVNYYWRLLTRASNGWVVRANGRVSVPICVNEGIPE